MELLLGSHVREHGNRVGRLAAIELDPSSRRIRRLFYSPNGEPGPNATGRAIVDVALVHDDGEIELRPYGEESGPQNAAPPLSRATRIRRGERYSGYLAGFETAEPEHTLAAVFVRQHWWSRRFELPAGGLDFSVPGEIRTGGTRAA
jgi:hypothetical protein